MRDVNRIIDSYTEKISSRPFIALAIILLVTVVIASGVLKVRTVEQQTEDLLPDSIASVNAFEVISSEFRSASGTTYTVLFHINPNYPNSTEIRDIRNPEFIRYLETVGKDISEMQKISSVSSAAQLLDNPSSIRDTQQQLERIGESRWTRYISEDYSAALMRITATSLSSEDKIEIADNIRQSVETINGPTGIKAGYTGDPYINKAFQQQTQNTMSTTGILSLLGVLIVVILLFRSFFSGIISLQTLIFGILAGFGAYGWLGLNMSPATSGAVSMGMGIAIDFGIQVVSRYHEEREGEGIQESLSMTINGVIYPMTVALIAAIIGFTSLSVGRITFLSSLGMMLILTTTFAYIGALTLLPVALVLYDKYLWKS